MSAHPDAYSLPIIAQVLENGKPDYRRSCCRLERQLVRVFEHGHRLLTRYIRETIEVLVKAQAAFQVGEQAVHRHTGALKTRRATQPIRINPDRHFRRIPQWQS